MTRALKAEITVLHLSQVGEANLDPSIRYETADPNLSIADNLRVAIGKLKPSMVVMFTDRQRTLFQRIFYPSQTENLSFQLKVPLLVMGKKE